MRPKASGNNRRVKIRLETSCSPRAKLRLQAVMAAAKAERRATFSFADSFTQDSPSLSGREFLAGAERCLRFLQAKFGLAGGAVVC